MDHSLFISDLHLCESRPAIINAFVSFLQETAIHANSLYILGDLFEYWAGDDAIALGKHEQSIHALNTLSQQGVELFLIHGNRDFLLGDTFAKAANLRILPDPSLISLYGTLTLLSHGDMLCTDDVDYQHFKAEVRSDAWKAQFLSEPLSNRIDYIESIRRKSEAEKSVKSMSIMDVNTVAVEALFLQHDCPPRLIHGHTHRPMQHQHHIKNNTYERWVLGDWYEKGSYLRVDKHGCHERQL
ncbi:MAG: UDP-2,3-diacylglucosamine diphosphatase [Methylophilaceae bacterium]|nr:UDP-2,3-diacylglucosamine diphosphatase [Methylophilaceae bacterium]